MMTTAFSLRSSHAPYNSWLRLSGFILIVITVFSLLGSPRAKADPLHESFSRLAHTIPAQVGIAFAPPGGWPTQFGDLQTAVAWSTMKVPLAIAAMRANLANSQQLATKAITASDNAAAEKLWTQLGTPPQAAQKIQNILREGGDTQTIVESRVIRPGFSAFGQTSWALSNQAIFASQLLCLNGAGPVVSMMSHIVPNQRWGLAGIQVPSKAGWGPGTSGGYLVRQFGVVGTPAGQLGVALAALPQDGKFESGISALNQLTQWLQNNAVALPGGRCNR